MEKADGSAFSHNHGTVRGFLASRIFVASLVCFMLALSQPVTLYSAEKPSKKATVQKEGLLNDSTVQAFLGKAEEQMKKGSYDSAGKILVRVYDYTKDVLITVKLFQGQYEKVLNEASTPLPEKEAILIKLKRMEQLRERYAGLKERSSFDLGYVYAKYGDGDKARKYLLEVLETAPFSTHKESLWMKSKAILLGLYNLEGEF
jgi:tetratricopeptide (TPR) repeat protein